jgi:nondiscriminating glutamyl-tRNA synthetase
MSNTPVRVRFAPSPTGYLHVGGLRTALFNYLFARKNGGSFILRIEDTDQSRFVEGARENLMESLRWAGIHFDEGPGIGGSLGPYVQSERLALYKEHAGMLVSGGNAYYCFCDVRDADERESRDSAMSRESHECRAMTQQEAGERINHGDPYAIRLRVPQQGSVVVKDALHGNIDVDMREIDDQVLLKSDGFPTYHLANVVDDHAMLITHVIRGEEWLPSTAKHVLLYNMLGWEPPVFAHLPLLLNSERKKLSKRYGDVSVEAFRARGYLPEALVNFVALLGWHGADDRELYTLKELEAAFSLDRVSSSGAVFDNGKLDWFNAQYLRSLPDDRLLPLCREFLDRAELDTSDALRVEKLAHALAGRVSTLSEFAEQCKVYLSENVKPENDEACQALEGEKARTVLSALLDQLGTDEEWSGGLLASAIKSVQSTTGVKGKELFMPVRVALTGSMHGPEMAVVGELLGRETCMRRISEAIA